MHSTTAPIPTARALAAGAAIGRGSAAPSARGPQKQSDAVAPAQQAAITALVHRWFERLGAWADAQPRHHRLGDWMCWRG